LNSAEIRPALLRRLDALEKLEPTYWEDEFYSLEALSDLTYRAALYERAREHRISLPFQEFDKPIDPNEILIETRGNTFISYSASKSPSIGTF
jgi:hypothetical protein